jgi:DNA (cytosine-5)-methyltransferase 1
VEIEAFAVANLVSKMESKQLGAAPIYTDVKTFPYKRFLGCVDILSGGFPCQPFSGAGLRKSVEDPRHLYPYISKGIRECRPRIVFLENVEGIISSKTADGESVLKYVLSDLEGMGYRATAGVFSASEVGAPHQRKRVFILGYSELVNTDSNGHGKHTATSKAKPIGGTEATIMSRSNELSDTECSRLRRGRRSEECGDDTNRIQSDKGERNELRSEVKRCGSNIPNTDGQGLEGLRKCNTSEGWEESDGQPRCSCKVWPSRPNQPQYEWEEPRTKPKLGGTTDGTSSRVDRLRLLGNGVVPATAAKAFVTLLGRLVD